MASAKKTDAELLQAQRRKLDRALREAGKVRSNFRNKKQLKAILKFAKKQQSCR